MNPDSLSPNPTPNPYGSTPPSPGPSVPQHNNFAPDKSDKTKKVVIIAAVAVVLVLAIVGVVASMSGGDDKKESNQPAPTSELTRDPTAIDIESVNNSINSSVTSLDDEKDFPEANLDDKSLEL